MENLFGSRTSQTIIAASVPFFMLSGFSLLRMHAQQAKQIKREAHADEHAFLSKARSLSSCSTTSSRASLADLHLDLAADNAFDSVFDNDVLEPRNLVGLGHITEPYNGNAAVSMIAHAFSDLVFTVADKESIPDLHQESQRVNLETRANAAEAIRGALSSGCLVSMVTSSQGVGQHLPEMIAIANDRTPCVFHIAAGILAEDLSMHGDVGEVLSLRQSGFAFLASSTPQEAYDLALLAHLASLRSSVPFLHFFDTHRVSDEMSRIRALHPTELNGLLSKYKSQLASARANRRTSDAPRATAAASKGYLRPNDVALAGYRCVPDLLDQMMDELAPLFQRRYRLLEYTGPADASSVVVVMGSAAQVVEEYVKSVDNEHEKIGILHVRLYRPWSARQLLKSLPPSVRRIAVLDQSQDTTGIGGLLFMDVLASFNSQEASELWQTATPRIIGGSYGGPDSLSFSPGMAKAVFDNLKSHSPVKNFIVGSTDEEDTFGRVLPVQSKFDTVPADIEQLLVWSRRHDGSVGAVKTVVRDIVKKTGASVQAFFAYDVDDQDEYGEVVNTHVRFGLKATDSQYQIQRADTVLCLDADVMDQFNVLDCLRPHGKFVLKTSAKGAALDDLLPSHVKRQLARKSAVLYTVDLDGIVADIELKSETLPNNRALLQALFLHSLTLWKNDASPQLSHLRDNSELLSVTSRLPTYLKRHGVPSSWYNVVLTNSLVPMKLSQAHSAKRSYVSGAAQTFSLVESESSISSSKSSSLSSEYGHSITSSSVTEFLEPKQLKSWYKLFPEAFQSESRVHFAGTHKCKVKVHERLTPESYDRNVFHMEVDLTGTGLSYQMGDALSVYPQNNAVMVKQFMEDFELDADEVLQINLASSDENVPARIEIVNVFQLLSQVLDLFGKPGKKFYKSLLARANNSTDPVELKKLQSVVDDTAEGKVIFAAYAAETVTFADLLRDFKSIRVSARDLLDIVSPIEPRLYSIASSSTMHPDAVHLLVVTEDWVTPSGKVQKGLCSNFLADIWPNNDVQYYISCGVKTSMMKLPEDPMKPIIMVGTGTGMAPFRAFVQHRVFQKSLGIAVGPMVLYFGARYQAKEFLYGDELLRYHENGRGVLTHLRTAWSRDQEAKIYVQDRVAEDAGLITSYLLDQGGSFYLCGTAGAMPNDVQEAIMSGFSKAKGLTKEQAKERISELKEDGRYVLEVY
jgi:sulfite reductase (NADPH) flavoprotein alpha-component